MIEKTIKSVLSKKFYDWVESIEDETLRKKVSENSMITGGAIASLLQNETPNDYDIYFKDYETTLEVAKYYVKKFNQKHPSTTAIVKTEFGIIEKDPLRIKIFIRSKGVAEVKKEESEPSVITEVIGSERNSSELDEINQEQLEKENTPEIEKKADNSDEDASQGRYRPVYITSNAITLSDKIQIIIRFYGTAKEVHKNFDFIHCTNYFIPDTRFLHIDKDALMSIMNKNLVYNGSLYPVCSIIRVRKFIKRGWHINAGYLLKMMFQISKLNLSDIKVLEDQLIGVDSAYFSALIDGLKRKQEKEPDFQITENYVVSIIDRIFN